jgi:hypothetical protein
VEGFINVGLEGGGGVGEAEGHDVKWIVKKIALN